MNKRRKRLLVGETVEVRQLDEGLRGAWHIGCVIGVSLCGRDVRYDHLLDDDGISKCVERVGVSNEIDGFKTSNGSLDKYRGRIRPPPPPLSRCRVKDFCYGLCVDVSYEDGWWEGVIFDREVGSEERNVFFPDEGDELRFNVRKLRVTRVWDEKTGDWSVRGAWVFLKLIGEIFNDSAMASPFWIKQLWYTLRQRGDFHRRILEWTLGELSLWRKLTKRASNALQKMYLAYGGDAVTLVFKNAKSVNKRRRTDHTREQRRKLQRRHYKDCFNDTNAETIKGHTDRQMGCQPLDKIEWETGGNVSTESALSMKELTLHSPPSYVEKSDARTHSSSLDYGENALHNDYYNAGSANSSNEFTPAKQNSQVLTDSGTLKASVDKLSGAVGNSLQVLLDYATVWKKTSKIIGVTDKARLQLEAIGWKICRKALKGKVRSYQYVSPEGKYYNSLISVCQDLIPAIVDDSNDLAYQKTASCREPVTAQKPEVANDQLQLDIGLNGISLAEDHVPEQGIDQERIACESNKEMGIEPFLLQLSGKSGGDDAVSGKECSRQAIMEYIRWMDENMKLKGILPNKLVDGIRMKAKNHLLAMGWTFKPELVSKESRELHYFTPQGKCFCSLYMACCAYDQWEDTYGNNNHKEDGIARQKGRSDEDKIADNKGQRSSSQSPYNSFRPLLQSLGDRLTQSSCIELVSDELDALASGPPLDMAIPILESGALRDSMDWSERRISHNQQEPEHVTRVHSVPVQTISADFLGAADCFLDSCEYRTQVDSHVSSTVPLASSTDELEAACPPLSLLNKEKGKSVTTGSHSEVLVYSRRGQCGRPDKIPKARIYESSKIKMDERVCFVSQSVAAEAMQEHDSVPKGRDRGKPPWRRKRKLECPSKTYLTRSCDVTRSLSLRAKGRNVKTILSWLIDNEVVLPRQKVYYIGKKHNKVMAEGRISDKGILCSCCSTMYSLSNFEAHAGSKNHRPAAHIFLKDGRSLLECQMELLSSKHHSSSISQPFRKMKLKGNQYRSDTICSICHYGGSLILCDRCPSSFHLTCINLKVLPKGRWFCPCCLCAICGKSDSSDGNGEFSEMTVMYCGQCHREYHVGCWNKRQKKELENFPLGHWFCDRRCSKIFRHLHKILGKQKSTLLKGLHWTILRSTNDLYRYDASVSETMTEFQSKISLALDVLHECFVPIIEQWTKSDLVADVLFNRSSDLNRLNFEGFYTMLLEKGDEVISVATIRIHGHKVAEMPLIGTRLQYRRQGMCRLLVTELENMLSDLGIERLILPAAPLLRDTWIHSFGFTEMTSSDMSELSGYTFLNFQDTSMCQKLLKIPRKEKNLPHTLLESNKVKCSDTTNLSSEAIPGVHVHPSDTGSDPVGDNERSFLMETPEQSFLETTDDHLVASSSMDLRRNEVLVDPEGRQKTLNEKHNIHMNTNRENISREPVQRCDDHFFLQIYRRRCTRISDANIKPIKHTAFCN